MLLVLSLLVVMSQAMFPESEQQFDIEPDDQLVMVGSKVILPCKIKNIKGVVQWTKDDVGLGTHRNLTGYDRYSMIGTDDLSDWYLQIYPVTFEDEGKYQCQVSPGNFTEPEIRSRVARILVMIAPEPPRIVQGSYLMTYEYMETELECISYGGRPPAWITWSDDQGNVMTRQQDFIEEIPDDNSRYTVRSVLKFIARPSYPKRNRTYTCYSRNFAEDTRQLVKINVEVKYPPHVDLVISSGATPDGLIPEGTEVSFECRVEANPCNVTYKWFLDGKILIGKSSHILSLPNITSDYQNAIVKCDVTNEYGSSQGTLMLDVFCGPTFRNKPQSVEAEISDTVVLSCDVTGNPRPYITWMHGDPLRIVGHDENFAVRVTPKTVGEYLCTAYIEGYEFIEAEATIYLRDVPVIESPRIQFGIEGDTVEIECTARSIPAPDLILWTFNGTEVEGAEFTILENPMPHGFRSTLLIRNSQKRHFGTYTCNITNSYGSDVLPISLLPPKKLPPWTIFTIAVTAVFVTVEIIVMIAFFVHSRYCWSQPVEDDNVIEQQTEEIIQNSSIPDSEAIQMITHNPRSRYFGDSRENEILRQASVYDVTPGCSRQPEDPNSITIEGPMLLEPTVPPMEVIPISIQRYKPKVTMRPRKQGINRTTDLKSFHCGFPTKKSVPKTRRWLRRYRCRTHEDIKRLSIINE